MVRIAGIVALACVDLVACGGVSATDVSRQFDDAGTAADGGSVEASADDAGACNGGAISHVVRSTLPVEAPPDAAVPTPSPSPRPDAGDAGLHFILPPDPCGTRTLNECASGPRSIFSCPVVSGPDGSAVHPGDAISVTVPITDEGLEAYSCFGLVDEGGFSDASSLLDAVKPGYLRTSGHLAPALAPGTVLHFTAEASGSNATSCTNDLTRLDFDVTVR